MITIYVSIKGQVVANGQKMNDLTNQNPGWYSVLKDNKIIGLHNKNQTSKCWLNLSLTMKYQLYKCVKLKHVHLILGNAEFSLGSIFTSKTWSAWVTGAKITENCI